jgi:HxlR-like helix-turn-helix protein
MARTDQPQRAPQGKYARTGYTSPIDAALQVIGGKYKVAILYHLRASVVRFGELRRLMPLATARMLTKQLRDLERERHDPAQSVPSGAAPGGLLSHRRGPEPGAHPRGAL